MRSPSFDAKKGERETKRSKFKSSSAAEREFYKALKKVAKASGHIVESHVEGLRITDEKKMMKALNDYAELLGPWAERQSAKLLAKVENSNDRAYKRKSKTMGKAIQMGVAKADTGKAAAALMREQVALIKSIPLEAGLRAQKIARDNILEGQRAKPDPSVIRRLEEEMGMTTEVATNRAKLIARTETARANASFVQARAQAIGVTHYVWRCTLDGTTRPSHKRMNRKVIAYDSPPTLSDGTTGHAGTFPNCKCWQDPVLPDLD